MLRWVPNSPKCYRTYQNSVNTKNSHLTKDPFPSLLLTARVLFLKQKALGSSSSSESLRPACTSTRSDAERKHKIWDGVFLLHELLVLTAHPQQRDSNTGSQISLPGSPDSPKRQKGYKQWEPGDSCLSLSLYFIGPQGEKYIAQLYASPGWYSCRIPGIHEYCRNQI